MARDYVANQSKDNNKISHRIICSGYYNPHIKGANIYYLKGQIRGKLLLQCVTLYLSNILVNALSVTIYYNSLQSVNQQVEMVRLEGLEPSRAYAHHPLKMACLPFHHNRMEYKWCLRTESNCRHTDFQSVALPTELPRHKWRPRSDLN